MVIGEAILSFTFFAGFIGILAWIVFRRLGKSRKRFKRLQLNDKVLVQTKVWGRVVSKEGKKAVVELSPHSRIEASPIQIIKFEPPPRSERTLCPGCGAPLHPEDRFCGTCGHPLA